MERPPTIPSLPLAVRSAILSPPGTEISTTASAAAPSFCATSSRLARIMTRGAGLIAGSPGGRGRPGRVTVPTPSPALNDTPAPGGARRTVATTSAPWVTSGSSPASLTMPARAKPAPNSYVASANSGRKPLGSATGTGSGKAPVSNASKAARAAPLAQAPVVQPRLKRAWLSASFMHGGLDRRAPGGQSRVRGRVNDPRPHDRRAALGQRQNDGHAGAFARLRAARRGDRRPQVGAGLYRPGVSRRRMRGGGSQSRFLGDGAGAAVGSRQRSLGGPSRPVRSVDGPLRRRSSAARAQRRVS